MGATRPGRIQTSREGDAARAACDNKATRSSLPQATSRAHGALLQHHAPLI